MNCIFQTPQIGDATVKVYVSQSKTEADLWVCLVNLKGISGQNGRWYVTHNRSEASHRMYFCHRGMADLTIYFVNNVSEAGWQRKEKRISGL